MSDPPPALTESPRRTRRRRFSPLFRRILFVNSVPLAILAGGLLYLDQYRDSLIISELAALRTQGEIIAAALGEAATETVTVTDERAPDATEVEQLQEMSVRQILRRLVEPAGIWARVYAPTGELLADSRFLPGSGGMIEVAPLPPLGDDEAWWAEVAERLYDGVVGWLPRRQRLPLYREFAEPRAGNYQEVQRALQGEVGWGMRETEARRLVLGVAVPVQRFRQVLGALYLTGEGSRVDRALRDVRFDVLRVALVSLAITVLLSIYLARTIARPIRRLALAADRVRHGQGRRLAALPDLSRRGDEIGDLSAALADMTRALWQRLDAIERFAADVVHEIKNPLTSLKSAVETAARLNDPAQQRKLLQIIVDDVSRIDRLLADIASASRLDAELSRGEAGPVDVASLLAALVDVHGATAGEGAPRLELEPIVAASTKGGLGKGGLGKGGLIVVGIEERLGQVLRNLIANAVSFSPPGGTIRLSARALAGTVEIAIDDEGPGIPENKLEQIFERFYSERPKSEKFGTHSGLGLAISRQIVEAHNGTLQAFNRRDEAGRVIGARFVLRLPAE